MQFIGMILTPARGRITFAGLVQFSFFIHTHAAHAIVTLEIFSDDRSEYLRANKMEHNFEPLKNDLILRTAWGMSHGIVEAG